METKHKTLNELINNNPYSNGWATPEAYALYIGELYASEENRKKDDSKVVVAFEGTNDIDNNGKQNVSENIDGLIRFFKDRGYTVFAPNKSEPVSLEVESVVDLIKQSIPETTSDTPIYQCGISDGKRQAIDIILQSQQPASVAFLSEDEIDRICELRFSADEDDKMFKLGIEVAQSELRKRVIDPVELLNWIFDNARKGFDKNIWFMDVEGEPVQHSTQEILQIYLTSK